MKLKLFVATTILLTLSLVAILQVKTHAAEQSVTSSWEYLTIRWGGRENTHIIRPGGKVEFVTQELRRVELLPKVHDRAFYMNVVMNGLTKEGYEFAGMSNDEIVMKRLLK